MNDPAPIADQDTTIAGVNTKADDAAVMRIGTVVDYNDATISVRVSGSDVTDFPYLLSYLPVAGEPVVLLRHGGAWVAVGGLAAVPPDALLHNPSFEDDTIGVAPSWWSVSHAVNIATVTVQSSLAGFELQGHKLLQVLNPNTAATTSTDLLSEAIPVVAGQRLSMSVFLQGTGGATSITGQVFWAFYLTPTVGVWPAVDTLVSGPLVTLNPGPPPVYVRMAPTTVPPGMMSARAVINIRIVPSGTANVSAAADRVVVLRLEDTVS